MEAAKAALIEAAADLFAESGEVSVRKIAQRAGVNHGLVHHYFGGKPGLKRAMMNHLAATQAAALDDFDSAIDASLAALRAAQADDRFWRVLARALLDGEKPEALQSTYPVVRELVTTMEAAGVEDARRRVAEGLAATLGWMMFSPWIRAATRLPKSEADALLPELLATQLADLLSENR